MKPLIKRHFSYLVSNLRNSREPSIKESKILQHCKSGALPKALTLLNTISSGDISVKPILYASLLQTCTKVVSFGNGIQIHAHVIKSGLETDRFVGNSLLALYFKLGPDFLETRKVFDGLFVKDVVSWSSMISGYIRVGKPQNSLQLFWEMLEFGVEPNGFSLSAVIKACSELGDLKQGRYFHGMAISRGFDSNPVISSALIDMYGRNHGVQDARQLFDELLEPDAICWTSVISTLTRNDLFEEALGFFYVMHRNHGLSPDGFTFGSVLTACANLGRLRRGKEVHAKVVTSGLCGNVVVESSLVDMYGKCRSISESKSVFDRMSNKNAISWSAMLGAYCQNGECETVINLVREMKEVDLYSFGTIIRACSSLAAVRQGKEVHCQYVRRGGWRDVIVESALVDLYAKCGCIDFAKRLFLLMPVRNMITWNSMIGGLAQNGRGREALELFEKMIKEGMKPDYITFIAVLFACSHAGLVDEGRKYFASMTKDYGIKHGTEHYTCMIDLLGRAELIEEAENLLENADCRYDSSLWAVLLGACTKSSDSITAERIAKKMIELAPDHHLSYVLLGNIYRAVGRWNDAVEIRKLMEDRGVKKMPGKSWIETERQLGSGLRMHNLSNVGKAVFP
ncbi:hypothetical protein QN277_009932 [Acacia crassicarpa]|uniref:Pentatricopeptide repeat-containing protein n=1 Tax=Acacia crassicarpa TaxID=499986 RepID=A0AAE1JK02_9FABA|nr:hypothetical protein QN277_009932 [Acacia crassicarpa]